MDQLGGTEANATMERVLIQTQTELSLFTLSVN